MNSALAASNGAFDQQRRVLRRCHDVTRLIDKQYLFRHDPTSGFPTVAFLGESHFYVHLIAGKEGRLEADFVPTERCNSCVFVQSDFAFESFHQREAVKPVGNGAAIMIGFAILLVSVHRMVVQRNICKRENVVVRNDVRIRRQLGAYYYVIVMEAGVCLVRHCCLLISVMPGINYYEPGRMRL